MQRVACVAVAAALEAVARLLRDMASASSIRELYSLLCAAEEATLDLDDFEHGVRLLLDAPRNADAAFICATQASRSCAADASSSPRALADRNDARARGLGRLASSVAFGT